MVAETICLRRQRKSNSLFLRSNRIYIFDKWRFRVSKWKNCKKDTLKRHLSYWKVGFCCSSRVYWDREDMSIKANRIFYDWVVRFIKINFRLGRHQFKKHKKQIAMLSQHLIEKQGARSEGLISLLSEWPIGSKTKRFVEISFSLFVLNEILLKRFRCFQYVCPFEKEN